MVSIRASNAGDGRRVMEIWRDAVEATHDFLQPEDRAAIEKELAEFLPFAPLWLAVDGRDRAVGFMLLAGSRMEALFIDPANRGQGVGRALVNHALTLHAAIATDVNEQNESAARGRPAPCGIGLAKARFCQASQIARLIRLAIWRAVHGALRPPHGGIHVSQVIICFYNICYVSPCSGLRTGKRWVFMTALVSFAPGDRRWTGKAAPTR